MNSGSDTSSLYFSSKSEEKNKTNLADGKCRTSHRAAAVKKGGFHDNHPDIGSYSVRATSFCAIECSDPISSRGLGGDV